MSCVDSDHDTHDNARRHSGLCIAIERGRIINQSKKLGVTAISSAEMEVVATRESFLKCA